MCHHNCPSVFTEISFQEEIKLQTPKVKFVLVQKGEIIKNKRKFKNNEGMQSLFSDPEPEGIHEIYYSIVVHLFYCWMSS